MKTLVATLDINYSKEITSLTFPYMEAYAKNIDADFKVITSRKFPDLPIPMEKFQLFNLCSNYDWTIFLDADCLINPKTYNFAKILDNDIIVVSQYLDIFNSKEPQFEIDNVMGVYNLNIHSPFHFLAFHKSQKNVVKPWDNPLQYVHYINFTTGMKKNNKSLKWHLDEFLLAVNIVKYGISTISLKDDFPHSTIAHNGNYLNVVDKIKNIKDNINQLLNMPNFKSNYF